MPGGSHPHPFTPSSTFLSKRPSTAPLAKHGERQFHLQVAEAIETRFGQLLETQPEMVAEHLAVAGATEKAVGFCLKAGDEIARSICSHRSHQPPF